MTFIARLGGSLPLSRERAHGDTEGKGEGHETQKFSSVVWCETGRSNVHILLVQCEGVGSVVGGCRHDGSGGRPGEDDCA